ncbi:hypothetical protein FJZ41_00190 [Candidatus Shapirobacteria bacterium]|nr:hypothetical protein [Candidatus Shapirobacteria bacterium]
MKKLINEYINYMKYERGFAESTITGRQKILDQFRRFLGKSALSTETIREFVRHKAIQKLSPYSLNDYIRDIKCFCKFLFEIGKTPQDYAYLIKRFKLPEKTAKVLSIKEMRVIICCPKRHYLILPLKRTYDLLFELLAKTGMRSNEISMLDCKDLRFDEGLIHIRFAKGGKQRYVPIPPDMKKRFKRWLKERKAEPDTPLFVTRDGNRMKGQTIRYELKLRAKVAGISKNVFSHMFRHSFITEMLRKDVSVAKVARMVGHANPLVTMKTYEHLVVDDLKEAIKKHPLVKEKKKVKLDKQRPNYLIKKPIEDKNDYLNIAFEKKYRYN